MVQAVRRPRDVIVQEAVLEEMDGGAACPGDTDDDTHSAIGCLFHTDSEPEDRVPIVGEIGDCDGTDSRSDDEETRDIVAADVSRYGPFDEAASAALWCDTVPLASSSESAGSSDTEVSSTQLVGENGYDLVDWAVGGSLQSGGSSSVVYHSGLSPSPRADCG